MPRPRWSTRAGAVTWVVDGTTLTVEVHGAVAPTDVLALGLAIRDTVAAAGIETVVCHGDGLMRPDLAVADLLARLEHLMRPAGVAVRVVGAPARLRELADLAGLEECLAGCWSALESGREAEQREEPRGVEEEVQPDDDPT